MSAVTLKQSDGIPLLPQKLLRLLSPAHLEFFKSHLRKANASLPLRLLEEIEQGGSDLSPDELCRRIYSKTDAKTKHTFNQLASYTFKLTGCLARNFPNYLAHNTGRIEQLVHEGSVAEANQLAEILLTMSEKICDFSTYLYCLKFLCQQASVNKDFAAALAFQEQLPAVVQCELTLQELFLHYRKNFNIADSKTFSEAETDANIRYFHRFFDHPAASIRLYAKYACISALYYFRPKQFESKEIYEELLPATLREFQNCAYVVFPFLTDFFTYLMFYKINTPYFHLDNRQHLKEFQNWVAHFQSVNFWKYYFNQPEVLAMNTKATFYDTKYFDQAHKKSFASTMTKQERKDIEDQIAICQRLLADKEMQEHFETYLISIRPIYACLLIIHPDKSTEEAVQFLESLLTSYQQKSFGVIADNIFMWLMIGYFALGKNEECIDTYKRYIKVVKGKVYYEENDITLHFYYYLARWLFTRRKQYLQKLRFTYQRIAKDAVHDSFRNSLQSVAADYKTPVFFEPWPDKSDEKPNQSHAST